ncbi:MAG: hypothetical protein AB7H77_03875 [Bdellovibrionales bacterium]
MSYALLRTAWLIMGFALVAVLPASARAAVTMVSDPAPGHEIPEFGSNTKIVGMFTGPKGQMVFEYWYNIDGRFMNGFYDTKTKKPLFDRGQENLIGEDDDLRDRLIKQAGLKKVETKMYKYKIPGGYVVNNSVEVDLTCYWPYSTTLTVGEAYYRPVELSLFTVLAEPETKDYQRDCKGVGGMARLTTHYRQGPAQFVADSTGGFWVILFDSRYAVHFDKNGKSDFFKNRKDPILAPAARMAKIQSDANEGLYQQQYYIDKQEALIVEAAQQQMLTQ